MKKSFALLAAAALALPVGCHRSHASTKADGVAPPPGEVWLNDRQVTEAKLEVKPLEEQVVDDTILSSGKITFEDVRVAHVFSPVTGRITKVHAELGARVKKGDPLATLESPDIGLVSADLHKAQADQIAAEHDYDRQKELYEKHATSQKDLEAAEDAFRKAKAELERARQKAFLLQGVGAGVSQSYVLKAALDGEVIARNVAPGVEVQGQYGGGQAVELFTIGELDKVWALADIFEMDLARVKVGSRVQVKIVTYPHHPFLGQVDWIAGTLDPVTRTARVRCALANEDRLLKPEMYATVAIHVEERKALAIPRSALLRLGDSTVVFVEMGRSADGRLRYERRPVILDETEGSQWLPVTHGLVRAEKIVVSGSILLAGML
jgi:membrane fusion protein, heavy metal efflux system